MAFVRVLVKSNLAEFRPSMPCWNRVDCNARSSASERLERRIGSLHRITDMTPPYRSFVQEHLEPRRVVSATLTSAGTLILTGTDSSDLLTAQFGANSVLVRTNSNTQSFVRSAVGRLSISGGDGADRIINKTNLRSTLAGHAGNDSIFGGRGRDTQLGGSGDDRLYWSEGHDALSGGEPGPNGEVDHVDYSAAPAQVELRHRGFADAPFDASVPLYVGVDGVPDNGIQPSAGERDYLDGESIDVIRLSNFDDGMQFDFGATFTSGKVTMFGGAGDDGFSAFDNFIVADGEEGDDYFSESNGSVIAFGGPGDDTLAADPADSTFDLGEGNNWLEFDPEFTSPVVLRGGIRNVRELRGRDDETPITIIGDDGPNIITSAPLRAAPGVYNGPLRIFAGNGNDSIVSNDGDDYIDAGAGNDTVYGQLGDDNIIGGKGRDKLYGGDENDRLLTRDGRRDTVRGGNGADVAVVDDDSNVTDVLSDVEHFD
jgi:Ca2+-binding RTX toxin-like protein